MNRTWRREVLRRWAPGLLGLAMAPAGMAGDAPGKRDNGMATVEPLVGAYYYPWYGKGLMHKTRWRRAMRLRLQPPQEPRAGLYDSRDRAVIADHIDQSTRGGIGFWAVSWWGPGSYTDRTFQEHILAHPDADRLKYAILYESTGRLGKMSRPTYRHWIPDLDYLKRTCFDDPRYLKVEGRPVVFVYLSRVYFRDQGHDALQAMRKQFPELYLVGDDVFFAPNATGRYRSAWARPFDAVTAYDVYGQSIGPLGATRKAVDALAANYRQAREAANQVGTAFIPAIAPGYNDTAVRRGHPGRARYLVDVEDSREGDLFRAMIRRAALPNLDPSCGNILMVTSFNEWFEDTQIEATSGDQPATARDESHSGEHFTGGQKYVDYGPLYLDILSEGVHGRPPGSTPGVGPERR